MNLAEKQLVKFLSAFFVLILGMAFFAAFFLIGVEGQIFGHYSQMKQTTDASGYFVWTPQVLEATITWLSGTFVSILCIWFFEREREEYMSGAKLTDFAWGMILYLVFLGLRGGLLLLPPDMLLSVTQLGLFSFIDGAVTKFYAVTLFALIAAMLFYFIGVYGGVDDMGKSTFWVFLIFGVIFIIAWIAFAFTSLYNFFLSVAVKACIFAFIAILLEAWYAKKEMPRTVKSILEYVSLLVITFALGGFINILFGV